MKKQILRRILILLVAPLLFAGALGCWENPFPSNAAEYPTFTYDLTDSSAYKLHVGFMPRVEFFDQMIDRDVLDYPPPTDYNQDVCNLVLSDVADTTSEVIGNGQCESFFTGAEDYRDTGTISELFFKFDVPKQRIIDCRDGVTDVCVVQLEAHASFTYRYFGTEKYDDATYTSPVIGELDLKSVDISPTQCAGDLIWDEATLECVVDATAPVCGDGVVDSTEECDDGNTVSGDGCSDICELETVCDDSDNDGICDIDDEDNDNDGWTDVEEDDCVTDPLDPNDTPLDDDGDGICNLLDDDELLSTSSEDGTASSADAFADQFSGGSCSLNPDAASDFSILFLLALLCLTTPVAVTLHIRKRR